MAVRSALLNVMVKAAEKAAKSLKRDFGEVENLQVSRKGTADFVSNADFQAQKILREELSKGRPDFGFLMEEKDDAPDTSTKRERWIVDPLDGTTNFLHGLPHWAISIGAERDGEIIAGVVYDPVKEELFWGEKGLGAYVGNKRLRVSVRRELHECVFATGIPFAGILDRNPRCLQQIAALMPKIAGIRRFGAAALDLAYVAAGRYEGYWESGLHRWDIAAGMLLVKEAGGFIKPIDPKADVMASGGLIASNTAIHDTFVDLIRNA